MRVLSNYQASSEGSGKKKKRAKSSSSKKNGQNTKGASTSKSKVFSPQMIKVYGILCMLFSILLAISILSYYFTCEKDRKFVMVADEELGNWVGNVGAYLAYFFVDFIFGVFSIGFPFLFFLYGVKLTFERTLLPLVPTTMTTLLTMAWASMTLALFVPEKFEFAAGN